LSSGVKRKGPEILDKSLEVKAVAGFPTHRAAGNKLIRRSQGKKSKANIKPRHKWEWKLRVAEVRIGKKYVKFENDYDRKALCW